MVLTMLTWNRLQSEQKAWSDRNFPPHTWLWPLWGVIEELGELAHARLKLEQGIRGTKEELVAEQQDALADGVIFLSDVCNQMGWKMGEVARSESPQEFQSTFSCPANKSPIRVMLSALASLMVNLEDKTNVPEGGIGIGTHEIFLYLSGLSGYCIEQGWDLQTLIDTTWAKVKQRDWKKNPASGDAEKISFTKGPISETKLADISATKLADWQGVSAPQLMTQAEAAKARPSYKNKKQEVQRPEVPEVVYKPQEKKDDTTT